MSNCRQVPTGIAARSTSNHLRNILGASDIANPLPERQLRPCVAADRATSKSSKAESSRPADAKQDHVRKAFDNFVGETFYGQMLKEMRKTVGKAAYFDGGRAEEVFRRPAGSEARREHGEGQRKPVHRTHVRAVRIKSEIETPRYRRALASGRGNARSVRPPSGSIASLHISASKENELMATLWESELAALLNDLTAVQEELLAFLADKRESLVAMDRARLDQLQGVERQLISRLQSCQRRRQELLAEAARQSRPSASLRSLANSLPAAERAGLEDQMTVAAERSRLLQNQSLANWVFVQRTLLYLTRLLEIIATAAALNRHMVEER